MDDLINRRALLAEMELDEPDSADENNPETKGMRSEWKHWMKKIKRFPAADAVEIEEYNDLAEDFIDYVCSGSPNPAPYCANACERCVDRRGWCENGSDECKGFRPKGYGERKENE